MGKRSFRLIAALIAALASMAYVGQFATAQDNGEEETGFQMSAQTAICTEGLPAPQQGCSPWDGVLVTTISDDESFSSSCTTSSSSGSFVSFCEIDPPFGSTITASIDPASIPAGYTLSPNQSLSQTIVVPDGPVDGPVYGPQFYIYPVADSGVLRMGATTAICTAGLPAPQQGCAPWDGVVVTVTSADNSFNTVCTTASSPDSVVSHCEINPPLGSTITASIDPASIPAGYVLDPGQSTSQTIDVPTSPPDAPVYGPQFYIYPLDETFELVTITAVCPVDNAGPFVGCTPWTDVIVNVSSPDYPLIEGCMTVATSDEIATCTVLVPFGVTIIASVNLDQVPAGYALETEASQTLVIPDGPPTGEFFGPIFTIYPIESEKPIDEPDKPENGDATISQLPDTGAGHPSESEMLLPTLLFAVAVALIAATATVRRRASIR